MLGEETTLRNGVTGKVERIKRIRIVTCAVFQAELSHVLGQLKGEIPGDCEIEVTCLESGLHSRLSTLKEKVHKILDESKDEKIILLYGSRCHPDFEELSKNYDVVRFEGANCISILSNDNVSPILDPKTFYLTPGWVMNWKEIFAGDFGLDEISMRQNLGYFDRMLLLSNDAVKIEDEQILEFFDVAGVPIEVEYAGLAGFRDLILSAIRNSAEM